MKVPSGYLGIKKPRIEMLPLIDIVFLLLVFFIYAMLSMAVHRSLPVVLPASSAAQVDTEQSLAVTVRPGGEIFLDKTRLSLKELQGVLAEKSRAAGKEKPLQVDLFSDRDVSYQELYRVLDIIRTAGIADVSLQAGDSR
ncbi:MAG: biopolymer transporter ExbD [Deltaproteobacteria bacterium]|jgi:biopolymer transport protein ExbD|nr:biopolymer transporter ExbD [Deltaproteobacteria bacterium]